MTDKEAHDYRMFQRESDYLRKEGKSESQINAASNEIDDRRAAMKLRSEAGGESILKPHPYQVQHQNMNYMHEDDGK